MDRFEEDEDDEEAEESAASTQKSQHQIVKLGVGWIPGLYPNWTEEHFPLTQYPNTPNVAPLKLPRAIVFVIGTEMHESRRRMNAASRNTVAGVAARPRMLTLINTQNQHAAP